MDVRIEKIGSVIRRERTRRGMTQEDLGAMVGVGKARISKIESGKGLTVATVVRVMDSLGLSASVAPSKPGHVDKRMVGYIIAAINEFSKTYGLTTREASNYLNRYKGLDFLVEHYPAEHLLSFEDAVQDLARVCRKNGGGIE